MNKDLEYRLRAHLWKEFNGYNALRYVRMEFLKTKVKQSIHICCLSSKAHEIKTYIENVFGLHGCEVRPYIETLGDMRDYTRLLWDNVTREELDCIDTLLRIRG